MSAGDEPELGSGAFYGGSAGNPDDAGGGLGGFPGLGGFSAMGGFPGMGPRGAMGPGGPYGAWPSCGCSSLFIILAGMLLVFGGCLRMLGQ
jgi:hypothetical protein